MSTKPWVTHLPAHQDNLPVDQPDLADDSFPGAGDGDLTQSSQVESLRDKADYCANQIGSNLIEAGSLRQRTGALESAMAAKANDSAVVHNTGTETVGGIKTFTLSPSVPNPSLSNDAANRTYVDTAVSSLSGNFAASVQTIADLRAVVAIDRHDHQIRLCDDKGALYRFAVDGTGADDGDATIIPSDITFPAPGRWFKTSSTTQNHEGLTGLQGGGTNDHQHLTTAQAGYLPSSGQKDALAGTSGTPSSSNKYVTDGDSRNTNSRAPNGSASGDLSGTYPSPTVAKLNGDSLPSNTNNGFLKRNSGSTAWEEVAYGSAANTVCQGNDGRLSDSRAPNGSASGDLSGSYPSPTVAKLNGDSLPTNAGNGFLKRNSGNTAWEEAAYGSGANTVCQGNDGRLSDDKTASGLRSASTVVAVAAATAPSTGQVLTATDSTHAIWQTPSGSADANAIHVNAATEIHGLTNKATPVGADEIVIEDSAASWVKKKVAISTLPGGSGTDANAVHVNVASEIHGVSSKASPIGADEIIIEDSADSWNKKRVAISTLPGGSSANGTIVSTYTLPSDVTVSAVQPSRTDIASVDITAVQNEQVLIDWAGYGNGDATGTDYIVVLTIDGVDYPNQPYGQVNDSGTYARNTSFSRMSPALSAGSITIKIRGAKGGSGQTSWLAKTGGVLTVTQFRGGLVPILDSGSLIQDKPKSLNFTGSGVTVTESSGDVSIDIPGGGSGVGGGDIAATLMQNTNSPSDVVVGFFTFDKNDFASATTIKFKGTGYVTNAALTGTLTLYNATDAVPVVALTFASVTAGEQSSSDIKASLPITHKTYEVRLKVTGGSGIGSNDLVVIGWAGIEIR